jgi:ribosomal-protein-alanine N-acetyltransferase
MAGDHPFPTDLRYRFRLFDADDLDDLRDLYGHPSSVQYLSVDGHPWTDDDLLRQVATWRDEFDQFGYTKWRVDTVDGEFVGRAGMSPLWGDPSQAEMGYCIRRELWGRGIATHLATIVRDWAWRHTTLPHLVGMTYPGNEPSQRVLTRIGMVSTGPQVFDGETFDTFRLDRPNPIR